MRSTSARIDRPGTAAGVAASVVRAYQLFLRPLLPPSCRFAPTCSEYARQSFVRHGLRTGAWLAVRRVARCHAWSPGGHDPVPDASSGEA